MESTKTLSIKMKSKAPCLVCGADSSGVNFSVRSCKPCGSFYRRCIAERKKYVCRSGNECPMDVKQRQQCRACRLRKCIEVGMSRDVSNNPTICAVPPLPETPPSNMTFQQKYPLLNDLTESWNSFKSAQKSLLQIVHPAAGKCDYNKEPQLITKSQYEGLEIGVASLLLTLLKENFESFTHLEENQSFRIYKRFSVRFNYLYKIFMTSQIFPDDSDDRTIVYDGFYLNVANLDYFFSECDMSNVNIDEIKSAGKSMFSKSLQIKRQFVRIKLREIEAAFLSGLIYYDEIEDVELMTSETDDCLRTIRKEMFENLLETYGLDEAIPRFANILKFVSDINKTCVYSTESMILINMMLPKKDHVNTWLTVDEDCRAPC